MYMFSNKLLLVGKQTFMVFKKEKQAPVFHWLISNGFILLNDLTDRRHGLAWRKLWRCGTM